MRTTTHKKRSTILLAIAASAAVTLFGAQATYAAPPPTDPNSTAEEAQVSGEDLFRAIVFGDVDRVPELAGQMPELTQTAEADAVIDSVVAQIDATNPEFFDEFAAEMQSGDARTVDSSLDGAAVVMADSLVDLGYAKESDLVSPQWAALAVFVFAAAAVVVGGVAVLTVQAVSTASVFWGPSSASANGTLSLEQEKQIAMLAETLD